MKLKLLTAILLFISLNTVGQTNTLNIQFLLACFDKGQTDVIEHTDNIKMNYVGIKEEEADLKTLQFEALNHIRLNLTYENNTCIFLQLVLGEDKIFYRIKGELLDLKPQFVKTTNDGNGVISTYKGNKYTYDVITDYLHGTKVNIIIIKVNS